MTASTIWDSPTLRYRDLPRLQELLRACDSALLKQVIVDDYLCLHKPPSSVQRDILYRRLQASLDQMTHLPLSKKRLKKWVLVPQESYVFQADRQSISWHLQASLLPLPRAHLIEHLLSSWDNRSTGAARGQNISAPSFLSDNDGEETESNLSSQLCHHLHENGNQTAAALGVRRYTLLPWEDILACRVWCGGSWCCRERYALLASAFWEMTFFGFEYAQARAKATQKRAAWEHSDERYPQLRNNKINREDKACFLKASYGLRAYEQFQEEQQHRLESRLDNINTQVQKVFLEYLLDMTMRLGRGSNHE